MYFTVKQPITFLFLILFTHLGCQLIGQQKPLGWPKKNDFFFHNNQNNHFGSRSATLENSLWYAQNWFDFTDHNDFFQWTNTVEKISPQSIIELSLIEKSNHGLWTHQLNQQFQKQDRQGFIENIIGDQEIEFQINGSVGGGFEAIYQQIDRPQSNQAARNNLDIGFDQFINLSLNGRIGKNIDLITNYDSQSTFRFQNDFKIRYRGSDLSFINPMQTLNNPNFIPFVPSQETQRDIYGALNSIEEELFGNNPYKDNIIQNIELGRLNMPIKSHLIDGVENLFGLRTDLKFGNTHLTTVISRQQSESQTIKSQTDGRIQTIELSAYDYQSNQHYFLAHFFRDHYQEWLSSYPYVLSSIQINRIEVWVTNQQYDTQDIRSIVAISDLGESSPKKTALDAHASNFFNTSNANSPVANQNNILDVTGESTNSILNNNIYNVSTLQQGFGRLESFVQEGIDYELVQNAVLLPPDQYTLNTQLGYLSLDFPLQEDQVLAVAFQYSYKGDIYQVGEFSDSNNDLNDQKESPLLIVKLLKNTLGQSDLPLWDLMMKNIYSTGSFGIDQNGFGLNIYYNNPKEGTYLVPDDMTIWPLDVENRSLLNLFKLDQLNSYQDRVEFGDGFFDFIPGLTIDPARGNIIFPMVEPFGKYLFDVLSSNSSSENYDELNTYNPNQKKYVFHQLYKQTRDLVQQDGDQNNFLFQIQLKSQYNGGISLGVVNISRGSVRVRYSGRVLQEGVDYMINYQTGIIRIINPTILFSGLPVDISVENNTLFNKQAKRFLGFRVDHRINNQLQINGTYLNLSEKPLTQKSIYGQEPVNNHIFGFGFHYQQKLPFIDRWVNNLPGSHHENSPPSFITFNAEVAKLELKTPKDTNFGGQAVTYIDDFETSGVKTSLKSPSDWILASVPGQGVMGSNQDGLESGFGRSKMAWYTIDPIFYNQTMDGIDPQELSSNTIRQIFIEELFPQRDLVKGTSSIQTTLDLAYYPQERGPYNNALEVQFQQSKKMNWAGVMREISNPNFSLSNVQYLEFWLLDTFSSQVSPSAYLGDLIFHLGNISEDILKDNKKQYENGLDPNDQDGSANISTAWGKVPRHKALFYSFNESDQSLKYQDLGLDGLSNADEALIYSNGNATDPAGDDYQFYLKAQGNLLERYKNFNGTQNNSFSSITQTNRSATRLPDVEDIDRDQNMNTSEQYFEYRIPISKNMDPTNHPYVVQVRNSSGNSSDNRNQFDARWLLFRIPIDPNFGQTPQNNPLIQSIGGIKTFQSLRFMRMLLRGFENQTVFRFGTLDLVMGNWRTANHRLNETVANPTAKVEVGLVNFIEHENRRPINYQVPTSIRREEFIHGNDFIRSNEQSLALKVLDLGPNESKGVFNSFDLDLTGYKILKMDIHAESLRNKLSLSGDGSPYDVDNSLVVFIRLGNDQHENYYQIEMPIRPTPIKDGSSRKYTAQEIWMPESNQLDVSIDFLMQLKAKIFPTLSRASPIYLDSDLKIIDPKQTFKNLPGIKKYRYSIRGFPALNQITSIVLGVKNANQELGQNLSGEIWFNELRLEGINQRGGRAIGGHIELNLSDFANIITSIKDNTSGFGSLSRSPSQTTNQSTLEYNISGNINLEYLLPKKWRLQIPLTFVKQKLTNTPDYDPIFRDLLLEDRLDHPTSGDKRTYLLKQFQEATSTQSLSLIGMKKSDTTITPPKLYSLENFSISASYNAYDFRSLQLEYQDQEDVYFSLAYRYDIQQKSLSLVKTNVSNEAIDDSLIQLNLFPSNIFFNMNIDRSLSTQRYRDLSVLSLDSSQSGLFPELVNADYQLNYQYGFDYSIFKALTLNFTANTSTILMDQTKNNKLKILDQFFKFGQPDQHYHTIDVNYQIPFNRFSWLNFIESNLNYSGNYSWKRGSSILNTPETKTIQASEAINVIQNNNTKSLTTRINFNRLMTSLGFEQSNSNRYRIGLQGIISKVLSFEELQFQYREENGIYLPGYLPKTGFVGISKPGLFWFSMGGQSDIRFEAAKKGWLTELPQISLNFEQHHRSTFDVSTDFNPSPNILIQLSASRSYSSKIVEDYRVQQNQYQSSFSNRMGSFDISGIFLKSIFRNLTAQADSQVEKFKESKLSIAQGLVAYYDLDPTIGDNGYPRGYHENHQDLLLYGFMEEFGRFDTKHLGYDFIAKIPLPNWTIQIDLVKGNPTDDRTIRRVYITNSYRGSYTINHFQTNIEFDKSNPFELDNKGYYKPQWIVSNANVVEQFNPLIGIDMEVNNVANFNFSINRDRATSLSLRNQLITQSASYEYSFQTDFQLLSRTNNLNNLNPKKLDAQINFSYRNHIKILRNLSNDTNQITNGQKTFNLQLSAQYRFSNRLVGRLFYNHDFTEQKVSFGFDQNIIRSGFSLRYDFNP